MWSLYKYMFFQIYTLQYKWFGASNNPGMVTIMTLTFNFLIIVTILEMLAVLIIDSREIFINLDNINYIVISVLVFVIHYFMFFFKGRYKDILIDYKKKYTSKDSHALIITFSPLLLYLVLLMILIGKNS